MMHKEALDFISRMRQGPMAKSFTKARRILEHGSLDINGTARPFFPVTSIYVGVDWRAGKGVDVVGRMHKFRAKENGFFDFAVSTETLEHDPHWQASLQRMIELLAPKGSLLITCAGPGRHAHDVDTSPLSGYYANPSMSQLASSILCLASFDVAMLEDDAVAHDLRFFGWRKR